MMNVLYDEFPDFVEVDGKLYKIITDFRDWIRLNDLVDDDEVNDIDKVNLLLMWFDGEIPDNIEGAIYALGDFLTARGIYRDSETGEKKKDIARAFSFSEDAGCIYSAFRECYGIDLQTVEYMHWWKFQTLFDWLPQDTEIKKRMMYRTVNLNDITDKEERKRVKRIQERIKLKKKHKKYVSDYDIGDAFA